MHINAKTELDKALTPLNRNVSYGYVRMYDGRKVLFTEASEFPAFFNALDAITYDCGYGSQELEGLIVFANGSWLSRWEYDGSEGWQYNATPSLSTVLDYFNRIED